MRQRSWIVAAALGSVVFLAGVAMAADQPTPQKAESQEQEAIYGSQLMTEEERAEYRQKIRTATSVEEREKIRSAHHEQMKARAKERGMALPDDMPPMGGGMGHGPGPGGRRP